MIQLIGCDPRNEAPVLNARIRKAWSNGAQIGLIGQPVDLTYDYFHMGDGRADLMATMDKKFDEVLKVPSVIIVGMGALREADGEAVLSQAMKLAEATDSKLMVLHTAAARVGAMDVGAVTEGGMTAALDGAEVVYNLGADEVEIAKGAFVIYQGSHGDRGAHRADVILPAAAYTEESGVFVNLEGRPQMANRAGFAPGDAKENWAILRALSAELGTALPYDTLAQLRQAIVAEVPHMAQIDVVPENEWKRVPLRDPAKKASFLNAINDFYLTNPIARASKLMGELSALAKARGEIKVAAE